MRVSWLKWKATLTKFQRKKTRGENVHHTQQHSSVRFFKSFASPSNLKNLLNVNTSHTKVGFSAIDSARWSTLWNRMGKIWIIWETYLMGYGEPRWWQDSVRIEEDEWQKSRKSGWGGHIVFLLLLLLFFPTFATDASGIDIWGTLLPVSNTFSIVSIRFHFELLVSSCLESLNKANFSWPSLSILSGCQQEDNLLLFFCFFLFYPWLYNVRAFLDLHFWFYSQKSHI